MTKQTRAKTHPTLRTAPLISSPLLRTDPRTFRTRLDHFRTIQTRKIRVSCVPAFLSVGARGRGWFFGFGCEPAHGAVGAVENWNVSRAR